jgi:polyhydroxybutyrate depolymerase
VTDAKPTGYPDGAHWPADDVAFTDAMLADVQAGLLVDRRRIYAAGFSSGGSMVLRLAVDRSRVFAAIGAAAGHIYGVHSPDRHLPIYAAVGNGDGHLLDEINHAPDGPFPPLTEVPLTYDEAFGLSGLADRFDDITGTVRLSNVPDQIWDFDDELHVGYRTPLSGNTDGNEVTVSIQKGVGHQYPKGDDNPEGFDDTDIFWKFFHDHPLPK